MNLLDIGFYEKISEIKKQLTKEKISYPKTELYDILEENRNMNPVVYNIETTNNCNMNCFMCPRPTKMTRKVMDMPMDIFEKTITQIHPWSNLEWYQWKHFVEQYYNIKQNDMSENHFFLYIIPKVLVLHGYGEPLIDKHIVERVERCTELDIPSYFSCNPWNLKNTEQGIKLMDAGLDYIKFSTDSADDFSIKQIRGKQANFSDSFNKIKQLIKLKEENSYETTIVITMLDLNRKNNISDFERLKQKFQNLDVYIYLKSQDQLWYDETGAKTGSIHWIEPCQFPWSSMTVKSNGECCQCVEDYNNEIILGDVNSQPLWEIWNSEKYRQLRWMHIKANHGWDAKCNKECDMRLIGEYTYG